MQSLPGKALLVLLVASLLAGCSLLRYRSAESPRVSVTDVQLAGFSIFEQKFDVGLRIQNPNNFDLPITGMDFNLLIEDSAVANGVSNARVTVPAYGEQAFTVSITGNFLSTLTQMQRWRQSSRSSLDYRLKGRLQMADVAVKIPFEQTGSFKLQQPAAE